MRITVQDIDHNLTRIPTTKTMPYLKHLIGKEAMAHSPLPKKVGTTVNHGFIDLLSLSFREHRPLVISPDEIWLLICQGFAKHITLHAEKYRDKLVQHQGKKQLKVIRDDFTLEGKNPWQEVVQGFSEQIRQDSHSNIYDVMVANFSTTTDTIRTAYEITLKRMRTPITFAYHLFSISHS